MPTVEVVVERADGSGQTIHEVALEPSLVIPAGTLHYIGGSNTWMAVEGYHRVPGNAGAFIPSWHSGGGSLWRWSAGISDYRANFAANGGASATVVWWNILIRAGEGSGSYESMVDNTLTWLRTVTAAPVVVSPLHSYDVEPGSNVLDHAGHVAVCDYAISVHNLIPGPGIDPAFPYGPLAASEIADGRHPNDAGRLRLGAWLVNYFDRYETSTGESL